MNAVAAFRDGHILDEAGIHGGDGRHEEPPLDESSGTVYELIVGSKGGWRT